VAGALLASCARHRGPGLGPGPEPGPGIGNVVVEGSFCPTVSSFVVAPLQASIGGTIDVAVSAQAASGDSLSFAWKATSGRFDNPTAAETSFVCEVAGSASLTVTVSTRSCSVSSAAPVTCVVQCPAPPPSGATAPPPLADGMGLAPATRYAGRRAADPPGALTTGERSLVEGSFSQKGTARWGDYTAMVVDPIDDCTFWYTNQYVKSPQPTKAGSGAWGTRIGVFRFPDCSCGAFGAPVFNLEGIPFTGSFPPDPVGDVGARQYVQAVNQPGGAVFAVYDKTTGQLVQPPAALHSLSAPGGACAAGAGDPIVMWDAPARRWLLAEVAASERDLCVYVSAGDSATGPWSRYDFPTPELPDYPKYGLFLDEVGKSAYLVTTNESSPAVYALERAAMLAGAPARMQRFTAPRLAGFDFQALTPAVLAGRRPYPRDAGAIFLRHRDDELHDPAASDPSRDFLELWELAFDFDDPASSALSGPVEVPISEFDSLICAPDAAGCFGQSGTATVLDPLREVVMWRLGYRSFGDHEALIGSFVVNVDGRGHGGVRWFELRRAAPDAGWSLHQEGTWAPDRAHRWMSSIAMDGMGDIALGYSTSLEDPPVADPYEPNDRPATATAIDCGFRSLHASVATATDVDYYLLRAAPGVTAAINVDAATDGSALDSVLGAFASDGRLLARNDDGIAPGEPVTTDSYLELPVPADGELVIAVASAGDAAFDGSGGRSSGPYTLTVSCITTPPDPNEPNDDTAHETPMVCPAATAGTAIAPPFDRDFYRFTGLEPGAPVSLAVDTASIGSPLDAEMFVFDSAGVLIASTPVVDLVGPDDGILQVEILAADLVSSGPYVLRCN
jgi:hypothetical protein